MIELTLNDKTYNVPESWDEVNLKQYVDILSERLDQYLSRVKVRLMAISILAGGGDEMFEMLRKLPDHSLNELLSAFAWVDVQPDYAFLPSKTTLNVDGKTFRIKHDFNTLSTDEVIYIEELMQNDKITLHHFEIAFGVLFREVDAEGNEKELTLDGFFEQIKQFRSKVYLKDVFGVLAFFLNGDSEHYSKTLQSSSTHQRPQTTMMLKKTTPAREQQSE